MREFKFRAWDPQYKYMNYRILIGNVSDSENYHAHSMWIEPKNVDYECEPHWSHFDEHSDIQIMQYSGLKDMNNVEIFEGDIIRIATYNNRYYVNKIVFEKGTFHFGHLQDGMCDYREMEVIGNVWEHSRLLEGEENAKNPE